MSKITEITADHSVPIRKVCTIKNSVLRCCRHNSGPASGGSFVAVFDLLVEPAEKENAVLFLNRAKNDPDVQRWVPSVVNGVKKFVQDKANEGIAVKGIKVTLSGLKDHPVDAKERFFTKFAAEAMADIFKEAGVEQAIELTRRQPDAEVAKQIREAILARDAEATALLIGTDLDRLKMMTPFGTWLHVAAKHGKLEIVKRLVAAGADVNAYGGISGGGALHLAASQGHVEVVKYLLENEAVLDVSEPERNPLFGAIYGGHADVARLLIERGIDTRVRYTGQKMKNMDALAFAREWGRDDIVKMLLPLAGRDEDPASTGRR